MFRKLILGLIILIVLLVVLAIAALLIIDPDDYRDEIAERASNTLGREVRLDGPMSLRVFPWLALEIEQVQVGNPTGFEDVPPLARVGRAVASVRVMPLIRGRLETGAISLSDTELTLVRLPDGQSNLDGLLAEREADPEAGRPDLSEVQIGALSIEDLRLVQLDPVAGTRSSIEVERLDLAPFRAGQATEFSLSARLADDAGDQLLIDRLTGRLTAAADLSSLRVDGLDLGFSRPDGALNGRAEAAVVIELGTPVELSVADVEVEVDAGGHALALSLAEPLRLSLDETVALSLNAAQLSIDGQTLRADGRLRLGDEVVAELAVRGQALDLRSMMADATSDTDAPPAEGAGPSTPPVLEGLDLSFDLDLDELILSEAMRFEQVETVARLRDGQLLLSPMRAGLFGGQADARVTIDFRTQPPSVSMQPQLVDVAVARVAALSGRDAPLSGLGDLQLQLDFQGLDPHSILATMNGEGRIEIEGGAIEGVNLRTLIEEELTSSNLANISRAFGGRTEFETFGAGITVRDGVIELPNLNLAAAGYGATGSGRIDFAADRVEYRMVLDLGPELLARLPRALRQATGGRVPLMIAGSVAAPTLSVDLERFVQDAGRNLLEEQLRRALEDRQEPRDDEADQPRDSGQDGEREGASDADVPETDRSGAAEDSEAETSEPPPERRERTSQLLLRTLLERSRDDTPEEEAESEEEATPEPPPRP